MDENKYQNSGETPSTPPTEPQFEAQPAPTTQPAQPDMTHKSNLPFMIGIAIIVIAIAAAAYFFMFPGTSTPDNTASQNGNTTATTQLTPEEAAEPVAYVNGATITRGDISESISALSQQAAQSGADPNDMVIQGEIESEAYRIAINNELLRQAATDAGTTPTEEEVNAQYDQIVAQNGGGEVFEQALADAGLTEEELRQNIADNLLIEGYLETILPEFTVTEEEVLAVYNGAGGEEAGLPPLEQVRPQVEAQVIAQKENEAVGTLLEELRAEAEIEQL